MKRKLPLISLFGCLALLCSCGAVDEPVEDPVTGAPYVFAGTVLKPQSSTVDSQPPGEGTFTVRVDEVVFQKGVFTDLTGSEITVLADDRKLESGGEYVFYTEPLVFGRSIAVRLIEIERGERTDPDAVRKAHERQELDRELRRADLVVVGRIEGVEPYQQKRRILSEHWPDLRVASLGIEKTLKGDISEGNLIEFLFSASRDVQWYRSPKVETGDTAVFLLEAGGDRAVSMQIEAKRYTLFEPMDVQPLESLDTIEELLK